MVPAAKIPASVAKDGECRHDWIGPGPYYSLSLDEMVASCQEMRPENGFAFN